MPDLAGDFDIVLQGGLGLVNELLARQHHEGTYFHSIAFSIDDASVGGDSTASSERTGVQGIADVQVGVPRVSLLPGPGARVAIAYDVRAMFAQRAGPLMPGFVHGELRVSVNVSRAVFQRGSVIEIDLADAGAEASFVPAPGTTIAPASEAIFTRLLRNVMRGSFEPVNAFLGDTGGESDLAIRHVRFTTLPAAPRPAVAVLVNIGDSVPADGAEASVTQGLIRGPDQFAVGIGSRFLASRIREAIFAALPESREVSRVRITDVITELRPGELTLILLGRLTTIGESTVRVAQRLAISLDFARNVVITPIGEIEIRVTGGLGETVFGLTGEEVRRQLTSVRDRILNEQARPLIQQLIATTPFETVLQRLQLRPAPQLHYTAIEIRADGLVLHGSVRPVRWSEPYARVHALDAGREWTAFDSWIPGGTIQRFSWLSNTHPFPTVIDETHRFTLRPPEGLSGPTVWCVRLAGMQTRTGGTPHPVTSRGCSIITPRVPPIIPYVEDQGFFLLVPGCFPDVVRGIHAHINPWSSRGFTRAAGTPLLVHFAGQQALTDADGLQRQIADAVGDLSLFYVLVVPGSESGKVRPTARAKTFTFAIAEDHAGAWAKHFGGQPDTTAFVQPNGEILWTGEPFGGAPALAKALGANGVPPDPIAWEPVQFAVPLGATAPDFLFEYAPGRNMALRKLRGRDVVLTFWTTWSEPARDELRYLDKQRRASQGDAPHVIAINDGQDPQLAADFFKREGLDLQLVTDPHRNISARYGVSCWPSSVLIDAGGIVTGFQFGVTPDDARFASKSVASSQ